MSRASRRAAAAILAVAVALSIAACGKRGTLEPADDDRQVYPRTYPTR